MSRRIIAERHQSSEPQERERARLEATRRDLWRDVLASNAGRFVLGDIIFALTPGEIFTGNSEIHKNAARADAAAWIETQIGQMNPEALIAIRAALIRARFSKKRHEENEKENDEEET
jgi:hypothetical protein